MSPNDDRSEPRQDERPPRPEHHDDEILDETLRLDESDPSRVPPASAPKPAAHAPRHGSEEELDRTLIEAGSDEGEDATLLEASRQEEPEQEEPEDATLAGGPEDPAADEAPTQPHGSARRDLTAEDPTLLEGDQPFDTALERQTQADRNVDTPDSERSTVVGDGTAATVPGATARRRQRDEDLVGTTLGGCELTSLLGKGAMGAVYQAQQLSLQRKVAVKTIRPEYCEEENFLKRFRQEALVVGRFNTPYVVQIYDVGLEESFHYILMEYVAGGSLLDRLKRLPDHRLDVSKAIRWMRQSAEGLLEAERLGVVHRDIKPANLLIDDNDRVKIADFGVAKSLESSIELTQSEGILGTPLYMSPEQCEGKKLDSRSDLYSLGATFYQALTGRPPFQAESVYAILQQKTTVEYLSPREALDLDTEAVPEPLNAVIERMTQKDPDLRYASFQELIDDLDAIEQGLEPSRPPRRPKESSSAGVLAAIAALIVLSVGGYFVYTELLGGEEPVTGGPKTSSTGIGLVPDGGNGGGGNGGGGNGGGGNGDNGPSTDLIETDPRDQRSEPPRETTSETNGRSFDWAAFSSQVGDYTERFASEGPTRTLEQDATDLRSSLAGRTAPDSAKAAREQLDLLIDSFERSRALQTAGILNATNSLRRDALQFPFATLDDYWSKVREPFESLRKENDAPWLGAWIDQSLATERQRLLDDIDADLAREREALSEQRQSFESWKLGVDEWEAILDRWDQARATVQDFRGGEGVEDPSASKLAAWRESIERRRELLATIAGFDEGLETLETETKKKLISPELLWPSADDLEALAREARALRETLQAAPLGDAQLPDFIFAPSTRLDRLSGIEATTAEWNARRQTVGEALEALAHRDLAGAERLLARSELESARAKAPVAGLVSAREAITAAFTALFDGPDLEAARQGFEKSRSDLSRSADQFAQIGDTSFADLASGAENYPSLCLERLKELRSVATSNMAKCLGGTARLGEEPVRVPPFYIDRFEVSVERYQEFMNWLAANRDEGLKLFDGNQDRLEDAIRGPDYLRQSPPPYPGGPIQWINYYEALAFARHEQKSLPRLAEWWVAAKGSAEGRVRRFAFDPDPGASGLPREASALSYGKSQPMSVDRGEEAVGFANGPSVHHLAGNVAEWLLADDEAREAELAGGAYSDHEARESRFAGEDRYVDRKRQRLAKYGFRCVLRPVELFGELAPQRE